MDKKRKLELQSLIALITALVKDLDIAPKDAVILCGKAFERSDNRLTDDKNV